MDGRKDMARIVVKDRPYALQVVQTQILYDIAWMLEEVLGRLQRPKGYIHPIAVTVTEATYLDFVIGMPHSPLFSITIYNDGPDDVYPSVNIHQKNVPLKLGESLQIDCQAPKIERLYLDVEEGRKAYIRGFGIY
jgi:hypothetical protein